MADPAIIAALPEHFRTLRAQVEEHVPSFATTATLKWSLLTLIDAAEFASKQLVALIPLVSAVEHRGQQQHVAPLGAGPRAHLGDPEAVDLRTGLPPGRPHP